MTTAARARALMTRAGGWLEPTPAGHALRTGRDRRSRVILHVDEGVFLELARDPGLTARRGGGWVARRTTTEKVASAPRPGFVEGERELMDGTGGTSRRRANLTPTALQWLAARRDAHGRPWLTLAEKAAGERLTHDAEEALRGPSLTLRWDALPISGSGTSRRAEPDDRAHRAGERVEAALRAAGPRLRPILEAVCVRGSALQAAEDQLGLRRRAARDQLRAGLQALARHYGIG